MKSGQPSKTRTDKPGPNQPRLPAEPTATAVYFGEDDIFRDPFADFGPSGR
jgi:hypothetical protein